LTVTGHPPSDITDANSTFAINQLFFRATYGGICTVPRQVSSCDRFLGLPRIHKSPRAIADLLAPHRVPKTRASLDTNQSHSTVDDAEQTPIVVLPSSTELFYVYGQTLEGCATLSTGRPLFDLLEVFKKWLRVYAGGKFSAFHQRSLFILCLQRKFSCHRCAGRLSSFI
jgi:hypothetical protein